MRCSAFPFGFTLSAAFAWLALLLLSPSPLLLLRNRRAQGGLFDKANQEQKQAASSAAESAATGISTRFCSTNNGACVAKTCPNKRSPYQCLSGSAEAELRFGFLMGYLSINDVCTQFALLLSHTGLILRLLCHLQQF